MKQLIRVGIFSIILSAFFLSSSVYAKPIKLTYSNFFPPKHIQSVLGQQWSDEVEKRTGGKVVVEYYPGQTLTKATQVYDRLYYGREGGNTRHD